MLLHPKQMETQREEGARDGAASWTGGVDGARCVLDGRRDRGRGGCDRHGGRPRRRTGTADGRDEQRTGAADDHDGLRTQQRTVATADGFETADPRRTAAEEGRDGGEAAELLGSRDDDGRRKEKRGGDGPHPHSPKVGTSRRREAAEVSKVEKNGSWEIRLV